MFSGSSSVCTIEQQGFHHGQDVDTTPSRPQSCKTSSSKSVITAITEPVSADLQTDKEASPSPSSLSDYPEGGLRAWMNVAGAFLLQMCCFGYTTSFGVYQDYYTRIYLTNVSSSAISWIGSINGFLVVASGIYVGRLFDRGYFYHLIYGGSLIQAFGLFMLSLAKPGQFYQVLLSQGIAAGLGGGLIYIPSIAVISQYFHRRRALAMTLVAAGSSLGAVVHPIMLNNTLPRLGFAVAARANAGLVAGLLLIACPLMRLRVPPQRASGRSGGGASEVWRMARKFARDPPYVFGTLGVSTFIVAFYYPVFYLQLDALNHGLSDAFSFYALVIANGCSLIGRVSSGFLVRLWRPGTIICVSALVCSAVVFGMIGLGSVASVVVIAVVYGLFAGAYVALLGPFFSSMADDQSEIGARLGIAFFFCGIGSLISGPIQGALLTSSFIWWRPAVFSGIVGFIGAACYTTANVLLWRKQLVAIAKPMNDVTAEKA